MVVAAIFQWLQYRVPVTEKVPQPTVVPSAIKLSTWQLVVSNSSFLKPSPALWFWEMFPEAWTKVHISSTPQYSLIIPYSVSYPIFFNNSLFRLQ